LHKKFPVTESYPTHTELLSDDGTATLYLVTTISDIAPETHSFEKESFFVLQGSCTCYVGDNIFHLSAGGYMDIPMHISHNVQVHPAQTVVAVLQHIKMAG
jgi:mannose-6-phosphate isomerase-like protein (cupin superfamily)